MQPDDPGQRITENHYHSNGNGMYKLKALYDKFRLLPGYAQDLSFVALGFLIGLFF